MADITTKAGRALAQRHAYCDPMSDTDAGIAAIEAEAVRAERARLAEAVRGLARHYPPYNAPNTSVDRADVLALIEEADDAPRS